MQRRHYALALVAAFAALVWWYAHREDQDFRVVAAVFGGNRAMDIVEHPDRVLAYRLDPDPSNDPAYPRTAGPVELPTATAADVSAALLSADTYLLGGGKGCEPLYGMLLEFVQGDDRVDVMFCFECDILLARRKDRPAAYGDFDYGRAVFVRAAKECFPGDEEIQALKE